MSVETPPGFAMSESKGAAVVSGSVPSTTLSTETHKVTTCVAEKEQANSLGFVFVRPSSCRLLCPVSWDCLEENIFGAGFMALPSVPSLCGRKRVEGKPASRLGPLWLVSPDPKHSSSRAAPRREVLAGKVKVKVKKKMMGVWVKCDCCWKSVIEVFVLVEEPSVSALGSDVS